MTLRYSLTTLRQALRNADAILAKPRTATDEDEYAETLDVLAHFAPHPDFQECYDWLAGCHVTDGERATILNTAHQISLQWWGAMQ